MRNDYGPSLMVSQDIHATKYRLAGESFYEAISRMAASMADDDAHRKELKEVLLDMRFMPAGRVQCAMGAPRQVTAFNCFVSGKIEDSMDSVMQRATEAAETMRRGGGIGYDFSQLRPRGDLIKTLDSRASGPVSFMRIYDAVCQTIACAGHRRGAQMGVLRVDHPDIEEFVAAKQNSTALTGFNVSIGVTDKFMEAVRDGKMFDLVFEGKKYRTIDARMLWDKIMRSTWDWAEPGVLFLDRINELNNLWYCEEIGATNPCVPGDTPILTDAGYVPIKDRVGKLTRIWDGESLVEVTPFSTGINPLLRVKLSDGTSLDCTPYHQWILAGGVRVLAEELKAGDRLEKFDMPVVEAGVDPEIDAYSQGFYSGDGSAGYNFSWIYEPKYEVIPWLTGTTSGYDAARKRCRWNHGPMLSKAFVPVNATSKYCLEWLSGIFDADGTVTRDLHGNGIQIVSVDREFLQNMRLMLTRLGVRAKVVGADRAGNRQMPDGKGGFAAYYCQETWRLLIGNTDTQHLMRLGLMCRRLKIHDGSPQRDARRFVVVESVEALDTEVETFCFTNPLTNRGTFNGIVTGQCGEQPLPPYGACLLGSFNLTKYVQKIASGYSFNWVQFEKDIVPVVRAMDNVIDRTIYPLPAQEIEAKQKRRMGLGVTGLANAAEALGHVYGSDGFLKFTRIVLQTLRDGAYRASALLAKEKGAFPLYRREPYLAGKFIQTLPQDVRQLIAEHGIRNSHLTSIAPTGTISLCADNVSSGVEPVFSHFYDRTIQTFDGPIVERVEDYGYRAWGVKGRTANAIKAAEHVAVVAVAQEFVDSAISKTCNVGPDVTFNEFKELYMWAWQQGCKGLTTFRANGKRFGVLNEVEDAVEQEPTAVACYIDPATGQKSCDS